MVANTSWAPGVLTTGSPSILFAPAFNAADLNSLANLASVMSTVALFDNTVALDQFMDVSFVGALVSASTIASGAGIALFLAVQQGNGVIVYDGRMSAGTQYASTTYTPLQNPLGGIPISPGTSITNIAGSALSIPIPPRKIGLVMQNQTGFAFAAGGVCSCTISTYRQNTNA